MDNMDEYEMSGKQLADKLKSNFDTGLTAEEALARLAKNGPNSVEYLRKRWGVQLILKAVFGGYKYFLWNNLLFCVMLQGLELVRGGSGDGDIMNLAGVILLLVLIASVKTACKRRPHSFMLKQLAQFVSQKVRVIRAGKICRIRLEQLVRGDLVQVKSGDLIPADMRLIEADKLYRNNVFLTGEMKTVLPNRNTLEIKSLFEAENVGLFGSLVMQGHARGLVVSTGTRTVMSKLVSRMVHGNRNKCLITKEIDQIKRLIRQSSAVIAVLSYVVFLMAGKTAIETAMFLCGYNIASISLYLQLNEYRDTECKTD